MACLAVLLLAGLAGCSSKPEAAADDSLAVPEGGSMLAAAVNETNVRMTFAGADREAELPVDESFQAADSCIIGFPDCPAGSLRSIDLTSIVPALAPVELSISLTTNGGLNAYVGIDEQTSMLQYSQERNAGTIRIDVLLVRGLDGVVTLELTNTGFSLDAATAGASVTGLVHTISRAAVVPAYLPISVQLGPGDVVNATGDGLEQLVAYPPTGPAIRLTQYPFELRIAKDAPEGDYYLIAMADEAVRLTGPNRTLTAHRLVYTQTDAVNVPMGQAVSWDMPLEGFPVRAGMRIVGKEDVPGCCGAAHYMGPRHIRLTSPDSVDVLAEDVDCLPIMGCQFSLIGNVGMSYMSGYLDEHLVKGTYTASLTVDQANNLQAYSWATVIE
ncbi:MAG: hypothetical protein QOJ26_334 [Thermoplasmata archaeon]|nr:hypothetical protein [Thermoplasmata archaeon]MEA3165477.1 hypothetical protein [Thermoplasmata archaeon]